MKSSAQQIHPEKTFTTFQVANICGVRAPTIIKWIKENKLKAYVTPGGHRRIQRRDLVDFLRQYNFPIPAELGQGTKKILIIEDDAGVGRMLQKAFRGRFGDKADVQWISDGIEALLMLGDNRADLLVLDVVMPVVDGTRVLATLRSDERTKGMKIIGITGKRLPADKLKFMQDHAEAFYCKPFNVAELVRTTEELLGAQPSARS